MWLNLHTKTTFCWSMYHCIWKNLSPALLNILNWTISLLDIWNCMILTAHVPKNSGHFLIGCPYYSPNSPFCGIKLCPLPSPAGLTSHCSNLSSRLTGPDSQPMESARSTALNTTRLAWEKDSPRFRSLAIATATGGHCSRVRKLWMVKTSTGILHFADKVITCIKNRGTHGSTKYGPIRVLFFNRELQIII